MLSLLTKEREREKENERMTDLRTTEIRNGKPKARNLKVGWKKLESVGVQSKTIL
jgi:hypothetical protein